MRIADYATTHNKAFITRDGRTTFALVYTAPVDGFGGSNLGPAIDRTVTAAVPGGWHVGVTGLQLLANGKPSSMSTGPQTDLKILATGLGAGILIDAVVVRCLLVPALVALFGKANWWLPAPLARLLRVPASPLPATASPAYAPLPGADRVPVAAR